MKSLEPHLLHSSYGDPKILLNQLLSTHAEDKRFVPSTSSVPHPPFDQGRPV